MKPDIAVGETAALDESDVDPCELFVAIGMLVLESRLPTASVKGRRDGLHCPQAVGHWSSHECDLTQPQCERAARIQKQMQTLWRNRVPMCIEVLLFANCEHGQFRCSTTDIAPPDVSDSCILLEQWTIQNVARKASEPASSARCLFQAVRSYLHFSQLSAWLNATHGTAPQYIGYRVSPPGEFCTSRFGISPELHVFPAAAVGKAVNLRATIQLLPRVPEIPRPVCHERHDVDASSESTTSKCARQQSPEVLEERGRSASPRFTKPNVLSHVMPSDCLSATTAGRCSVQEYSVGSVQTNKSDVYNQLSCTTVTCEPVDISGRLSSAVMAKCPTVTSRGLGAIPKQFELPLHSVVSSSSEVCCGVTFCEPSLSVADRIAQCKAVASATAVPPQILALQKSSPKAVCYASRRRSMQPKDGTDSDSSSPDIDAYLSTTLANSRLEPLSPQEMDVYLSTMYPQRMHKFKSVSSSFKLKSPEVANRSSRYMKTDTQVNRSELDSPCSDSSLGDVLKSVGYRTPPCHRRSSSTHMESERNGVGSGQTSDIERFDKELTDVNNCSSPADDDCVFESSNSVDVIPSNRTACGQPGNTNRQLVYHKHDVVQPKFLVGDEQVEDSKISTKSTSVTEEAASQSPVLLHKSVSCPNKKALGDNGASFHKANCLLRTVMMKKELQTSTVAEICEARIDNKKGNSVPSAQDIAGFRQCLRKGASALFNAATGLPLQSSPAPIKRASSSSFDYDNSLTTVRSIKNSLSCVNLDKHDVENGSSDHMLQRTYSTSAPATTNCLLGNFEESMLNGRIEPTGAVEGFTVDIGASGSFCPKHVTLPVAAFFFTLSDDNAPSPYLGHISLDSLPRRGYHIPAKGTVQVTLFNPNKTVVKMFVVVYDLSDMPPNCQTFLRQRTLYMPVKGSPSDTPNFMIYLRYLIHLRFASSKSGKIYLHTDIRVIFARDKFELDSRVANYELRSFTEGPENPKYAPRRQ